MSTLQLITVKEKLYYSVEELFQRGWSYEEIENVLGGADSRKRNGRMSRKSFFYVDLFGIDRVEVAEVEWMGRLVDPTIEEVFEKNNRHSQTRWFARLSDGRVFGGSSDVGFKSAESLLSYHKKVFDEN